MQILKSKHTNLSLFLLILLQYEISSKLSHQFEINIILKSTFLTSQKHENDKGMIYMQCYHYSLYVTETEHIFSWSHRYPDSEHSHVSIKDRQ